MARYTDRRCVRCRRAREKLFLKGERCFTEKCALSRRPGSEPRKRGKKLSAYSLQLLEKQKLKAIYGVLERQFRLYFERAERKGNPAENLLGLLEQRLDNAVYRLGFASSRSQARQVVRHGHIVVNGKKVDIPSYTVKLGDLIGVRDKSRKLSVIKEGLENKDPVSVVGWLELDKERMAGKVLRLPTIEDAGDIPVNPRLVVELYSK